MKVKSKIDVWISLIFWLSILIIAVSMFFVPESLFIIGILISVPIIIFLMWIYFGTYYELKEEYLYCKCGPFFERIFYDKIKSIRLSKSLLSSMALSIERIEIKQHNKKYFTGTTLISPKKRKDFMEKLINRCNNLKNRNGC